jgi:ferritin-like metal-binding protein YciE
MSTQTKTNGRTDEKSQKTLADYLGDLINVESHIEAALDHQKNETKDDPTAGPLVQHFHDMVKNQRDALKAIQTEKGSTAGNPVSEIGSAILGKVAGAINMIRTEGVSKSLRDDYVAFNLAAISYTMMFTTATALGDSQLANISQRHLTSYANAIQKINHAIPDVVVRELTKDNHDVQSGAAQTTITVVDKAWKTTTA